MHADVDSPGLPNSIAVTFIATNPIEAANDAFSIDVDALKVGDACRIRMIKGGLTTLTT